MMQFFCSPKLLGKLSKTPEPANPGVPALFSWSLDLIRINQQKALVGVCDRNRFGFVVYGMSSKNYARLTEYALKGIRTAMSAAGVAPHVIDRYLDEAGTDPLFAALDEGSPSARLSHACQRVQHFPELLDAGHSQQPILDRCLNGDFVRPAGTADDYGLVYAKLHRDLAELTGASNVVSTPAAELEISLDLKRYTAMRCLRIPLFCTFSELHCAIQTLYGWQDEHLHQFDLIDASGHSRTISGDQDDEWDLSTTHTVDESRACLGEYLRTGQEFLYLYDFGDSWELPIRVKAILEDFDSVHPICTALEGFGPPEDVGGVSGYLELLDALDDPQHPRHSELTEWTCGWWTPESDPAKLNRLLTQ